MILRIPYLNKFWRSGDHARLMRDASAATVVDLVITENAMYFESVQQYATENLMWREMARVWMDLTRTVIFTHAFDR